MTFLSLLLSRPQYLTILRPLHIFSVTIQMMVFAFWNHITPTENRLYITSTWTRRSLIRIQTTVRETGGHANVIYRSVQRSHDPKFWNAFVFVSIVKFEFFFNNSKFELLKPHDVKNEFLDAKKHLNFARILFQRVTLFCFFSNPEMVLTEVSVAVIFPTSTLFQRNGFKLRNLIIIRIITDHKKEKHGWDELV